jgi:hypothetical protein
MEVSQLNYQIIISFPQTLIPGNAATLVCYTSCYLGWQRGLQWLIMLLNICAGKTPLGQ